MHSQIQHKAHLELITNKESRMHLKWLYCHNHNYPIDNDNNRSYWHKWTSFCSFTLHLLCIKCLLSIYSMPIEPMQINWIFQRCLLFDIGSYELSNYFLFALALWLDAQAIPIRISMRLSFPQHISDLLFSSRWPQCLLRWMALSLLRFHSTNDVWEVKFKNKLKEKTKKTD